MIDSIAGHSVMENQRQQENEGCGVPDSLVVYGVHPKLLRKIVHFSAIDITVLIQGAAVCKNHRKIQKDVSSIQVIHWWISLFTLLSHCPLVSLILMRDFIALFLINGLMGLVKLCLCKCWIYFNKFENKNDRCCELVCWWYSRAGTLVRFSTSNPISLWIDWDTSMSCRNLIVEE